MIVDVLKSVLTHSCTRRLLLRLRPWPPEQRFAVLVEQIAPLLAQNKFDAITRFRELQTLVEGSELAGSIDEMGGALAKFRFDQVLERLRHVVESRQPN